MDHKAVRIRKTDDEKVGAFTWTLPGDISAHLSQLPPHVCGEIKEGLRLGLEGLMHLMLNNLRSPDPKKTQELKILMYELTKAKPIIKTITGNDRSAG